MVALFACLEEHISIKDCGCKVAPKAGSWGFAGNVCGADMPRKSGIYLLEEKESPFALRRIITFLSICACSYLLFLCMKLHHGMIATRGRKSYHSFGWWRAHLSDWRLDGGAYKGASGLCLQMHPEIAVFLTAAAWYHYSRKCSAVWCCHCLFWHCLYVPVWDWNRVKSSRYRLVPLLC